MWRRSDISFAIFLGLLLYVGWELRHALLLLYAAIILAVVLAPAVDWLRRWHIGRWHPGRGAGVLIFLLLAAGAATLIGFVGVPPLSRQARLFVDQWPQRVNELAVRLHGLSFAASLNPAELQDQLRQYLAGILQTFSSAGAALIATATLLLLTAYFIVDGHRAFRWFLSLCARPHADRLIATLSSAKERISRWIFGQLLLMLFIAVADLIVYGALGINYFYVLAIFAGLMNFVPVIGPLIGLVPAVVITATQSVTQLIAVLAFYGIYQQIDNSYITPRVMRATLDISALAVVIALVIGAELAGILGAFVAIPTAALIEVLMREYLIKQPARL